MKVIDFQHILKYELECLHSSPWAASSIQSRVEVEISTQVPTSIDNKSLKHLRHVQGQQGIDWEGKDRQGPLVDAKDSSR